MEYDWSPLMARSGGIVEELRCYTMESGGQFVMTLGLSVMPELLAGQSGALSIQYHKIWYITEKCSVQKYIDSNKIYCLL